MGQFSRRRWPAEGPVRELLEYLDRLHSEAGQPSLSEIGRAVALAPSTLSGFFTGARRISRGNLELVVEHLGGDVQGAEMLRRRAATAWNSVRARSSGGAGRGAVEAQAASADIGPRSEVRILPAPANRLNLGNGQHIAGPEGTGAARGHFAMRGRGQRSHARGGDLFRGRGVALKAVSGWLEAVQAPGLVLVVTGQPGAGKSAVVSRAVLDMEEAARQEGGPGAWLGLAFHARDATLAQFLAAIGEVTGMVPADAIPDMIDQVRSAVAGRVLRLVVDALDEAATDTARRGLVQALTELAGLAVVRVVAATRGLAAGQADRFGPDSVLRALGVRVEVDQVRR